MENNIRRIRQSKGMTLEEVAEAANTSFAQIQKLEKGERRLTIEWMSRIAGALGVRSHDLLADEPLPMVSIAAYVGNDGEVYPYNDTEKTPEETEVECPPGLNPRHVIAIRVRGDSMYPVFHNGWIVYYSERQDIDIPVLRDGFQVPYNQRTEERLSEFFKKPCIVKLADGRTMLKTLKEGRTPGRYTLSSYNAPDLDEVQVEWAAKIIFIKTA